MSVVIETQYLSKQFPNGTKAVSDVSISIQKGDIYGLIGLNGAGKTTLFRLLLGMNKPTSGVSYLNGKRVSKWAYEVYQDVGYMIETPYAYSELTVLENMQLMAKLRLQKNEKVIVEMLQLLELTTYKHTKAKHLSLGNKQRLGIAKALVHEPSILLLDEPMNGLDPSGIVDIRHILKRLAKEKGVTILISSHILSELAHISSQIGIIHEGKLLEETSAKALANKTGERLVLETKNNSLAMQILMNMDFSPRKVDEKIVLTDERAIQTRDTIAKELIFQQCSLTHLSVERLSLEDYFLQVIEAKGQRI